MDLDYTSIIKVSKQPAKITATPTSNHSNQYEWHPDIDSINEDSFREVAQYLGNRIKMIHIEAPEEANSAIPVGLPEYLLRALRLPSLYSHQCEAYYSLKEGKSIVLATATSSGKTNAYLPYGLQSAIEEGATTLLIYPLKALMADQYAKLSAINSRLPDPVKIGLINGDVTTEERKEIMRGGHPSIIAINPDVLHTMLYRANGHNGWEQFNVFLSKLKLIVIDEGHTYRSSFGSHFGNVMSRLRICIELAKGDLSKVRYVLSTATIGNPKELASQFFGKSPEEIHLIDKSGAIKSEKTSLLLKPSYGINTDTIVAAYSCLNQGLKTLIFCNSRNSAKNLTFLMQREFNRPDQIAFFHGSLPPKKRAQIIEDLSSGRLMCVLTTEALEAGLDLPELNAVIIKGFPESLMAYKQRIGRAGRGKTPGLIIFIPNINDPLDFFYGNRPHLLFSAPMEKATANPAYPSILAQHLICSGSESGLPINLLHHFSGSVPQIIDLLVERQKLTKKYGGWYTEANFPHFTVKLRGSENSQVRLVEWKVEPKEQNQSKRKTPPEDVIETMALSTAHREVHKGAIYTTQEDGTLIHWEVVDLDQENLRALLRKVKTDDFTESDASLFVTRSESETACLAEPRKIKLVKGGLRISLWWCSIVSQVSGYSRYRRKFIISCPNSRCGNHGNPLTDKKCYKCKSRTKEIQIRELVNKEGFQEALYTQYQAPALLIEINEEANNYLKQIAGEFYQKMVEKYGTELPEHYHILELEENKIGTLAIHSLTHLLIKGVPRLILASPNDLNSLMQSTASKVSAAAGYIFDTVHGGNGSSEAVEQDFEKLAELAFEMAKSCDCKDEGCPKCLYLYHCPEQNEALSKFLGLNLLKQIIDQNKDTIDIVAN
jgi:DEAD/DEAH box helicase domain-containing protein